MTYSNLAKRLAYKRKWRKSRRDTWIGDNGPCIDCGSKVDLEIDHVDPSTKLSNVSALWTRAEKYRLPELAKCVVRCKICHGKKTKLERARKCKHGTYSMWKKKKCRCHDCVMAHREYTRNYRAKGGVHG